MKKRYKINLTQGGETMTIILDAISIYDIACFSCNCPGGDGSNCSQLLND